MSYWYFNNGFIDKYSIEDCHDRTWYCSIYDGNQVLIGRTCYKSLDEIQKYQSQIKEFESQYKCQLPVLPIIYTTPRKDYTFIGFQSKYFKKLKYYKQSPIINKHIILQLLYFNKFLALHNYYYIETYQSSIIIYNNKCYLDVWDCFIPLNLNQRPDILDLKKLVYSACIDQLIIESFDITLNLDKLISILHSF